MKFQIFFFLVAAIPAVSLAKPAGPKCVQRIINSIINEMVDPCGKPRPDSDPKKEVLYFTYTDVSGRASEYIPAENCGFDSNDGLGTFQVKFKSTAHGDCRIVEISDVN